MRLFSKCEVFSVFFAALFSGCGTSTSDIPAVNNFEPERYLGHWYEIARLPHRFERGLDYVRAEYSRAPDGSIKVINSGVRDGEVRTAVGRAKLKNPEAVPLEGELRVSFFRPFYGDYRIIELDPEYRYAVVTGSTRDFLWILSRTPTLPEAQLAEILDRLGKLGFALDKLEFPRQETTSGAP